MNILNKAFAALLLSVLLGACGGGGGGGDTGGGGVIPPASTLDTDGDGLTDVLEKQYGTNPNVKDTDGDGFLDKEEVENWDPNTGNHLRFNPLVADVPRLLVERLGTPDIQLIAETVESGAFTRGMSNESENEVKVTTDRGRTNVHAIEEQHAVNVNGEVKKRGPITTGKVAASYDYEHTDTNTETNYWNETKVETNRQASSDFFSKMQSETVTTKGGQIKVLMGLLNDGDVSYTVNNLDLTAYMENPRKPGDLIPVGTLTHNGSMTFTPVPLGPQVVPTAQDFVPFTFEFITSNPQEIRRVLEESNQLVLKPTNISLTGSRPDVDLNLAAQNIRSRTAEVIIDYGDNFAKGTERYHVAIDNGNGSTLSFADLMNSRLNIAFAFSNQAFPGFSNGHTGLTTVRTVSMNTNTHSYWLVAHTFTPAGSPAGTRDTRLYNILSQDYSAADLTLRKGDVLHMVYITDTDLDGLSDRLEVLEGTRLDVADSDGDGLDDAQEIYGWYTNLATAPCDAGTQYLVHSNALLPDSDGDTITDLDESNACTNPMGDLAVNAGVDKLVSVNENVTLSAQVSNAQNANTLQYQWTQTDGVSVGQLPATANLSFSAPAGVTRLEFEVTVTDTAQNNQIASDRVSVFVARDKASAVFVDQDFGHDFNNTGLSPDSPFKTLAQAMTVPGDIYLNTPDNGGVYQFADTITLDQGTRSIFGGFDLGWTHAPAASPTPIVVDQAVALQLSGVVEQTLSGISVLANPPVNGQVNSVAISADGSGNLTLDRVTVQGGNLGAPALTNAQIDSYVAASSYGVMATNLNRLDILSSVVTAGTGSPGVKGVTGAVGAVGHKGGNASDISGGGGGAGHNGGNGGGGASATGGVVACTGGSTGSKGANSTDNSNSTINGGGGGSAGTASLNFLVCTSTAGGTGGSVSTRARTGASGTPASGSTAFNGATYIPNAGFTGGQGTGGAGGGGGGSGPGIDLNNGGGGGGGGEGGEGGFGGHGGRGAGGSFGVAVSNVSFISVSGSTISSGTGVSGGAGGNGGTGGNGGGGGSGADTGARKGGNGGTGGPGGNGGAGGGGSGGPVAAVVLLDSSTIDVTDSILATGNAGNGLNPNAGLGGWNYGIFQNNSTINQVLGTTYQLGAPGNGASTGQISP